MGWYNASWPYRVKVTTLAVKVDADLVAFPVYVDLNGLPAGFHSNVNQTDARDIRVTTSDGTTEVPREVVFYTAASDTGELHFKADVDGDTDTDFYIYYGNTSAVEPDVTDTYGRNAVWTDYKAIYHLQQGGTTSANAYTDSSGNNAGGTGVNNVSTISPAQINVGTGFDGTTDYIDAGNDTDLQIVSTSLYISAWVWRTAGDTTYGSIVGKSGGGSGNVAASYDMYIIASGEGALSGKIRLVRGNGSSNANGNSDTAITSGQWNHIVASQSGTTVSFYLNGAADGTPSVSTTLGDGGNSCRLGSRQDNV